MRSWLFELALSRKPDENEFRLRLSSLCAITLRSGPVSVGAAFFSDDGRELLVLPNDTMRLRDQTEYHWPIMFSYNETTKLWMGKPGPLHLGFDGLQADSLGELNTYWALTPARPWAGIVERSAFLPIQDRVSV